MQEWEMNSKAFRECYDNYFSFLNHGLKQYPLSPEEREDILQQTFLSFWIVSQSSLITKPGGFLLTTARNRALSLLRHRRVARHENLESHTELTTECLASADVTVAQEKETREQTISLVRTALHKHTRKTDDDTLWQRYAQGRKLREIAKDRREPLGTVCSKVNPARIPKPVLDSLRRQALALQENEL
jgi:DNA-directed RNA polymerase specialized sigma24 family protein